MSDIPYIAILKRSSVCLAICLLSGSPMAATIITDATALKNNPVNAKQFYSESGLSSESSKVPVGGVSDFPLSYGVQGLIPEGWHVNYAHDVEKTIISWQGGQSWQQIIFNIAQKYQINTHVDWISKEISFNGSPLKKVLADTEMQTAKLDDEKRAFTLKEAKQWQQKSQLENELNNKRNQLEALYAQQSDFAKNSNTHIDQLENKLLEKQAQMEKLKNEVSNLSAANAQLTQKYSVIDEKGNTQLDLSINQLFDTYKNKNILPFDKSFEYFSKQGGYKDIIDPYTPATYIARSGTVEEVFARWAKEHNMLFDYRSKTEHYNKFRVEYQGTLVEISKSFLESYSSSRRALRMRFLPEITSDDQRLKGLLVIEDLNFGHH